jgi:hypothetical protein
LKRFDGIRYAIDCFIQERALDGQNIVGHDRRSAGASSKVSVLGRRDLLNRLLVGYSSAACVEVLCHLRHGDATSRKGDNGGRASGENRRNPGGTRKEDLCRGGGLTSNSGDVKALAQSVTHPVCVRDDGSVGHVAEILPLSGYTAVLYGRWTIAVVVCATRPNEQGYKH